MIQLNKKHLPKCKKCVKTFGFLVLEILLLFTQTVVYAQGLFTQPEFIIYGGTANDTVTIKLGSWGGGIGKSSTVTTYGGTNSIEITSKGLYQGGRIDFAKPVDLTKFFSNPDAYLQLVTKFQGMQTPADELTYGVAAYGTTDIYAPGPRMGKPVRRVQVILFFEGGQSTECQVDISAFKVGEDGWMNISFPFAVLKSKLSLSTYNLLRLVITGDGTETFYVGEIRVIRDDTPLEADAGEPKETGKNYPIIFHGRTRQGASGVKYSWDFDKSDGIQEEAIGDLVSHRYPNPGEYTVTLTVSDIFGLKKPATSTVDVKIND